MKLTIDRGALLHALAHVQGVVERRNTIPILANVLMKADKGGLHLTATDMEIEIVETVGADVAQPGATTAPAAMLYDIVRKLPEGADVELDCPAGKDQLTIKAGRSHFKLGCLPVDDFPAMSAGELGNKLQLKATDLAHLIDRTKFAMSTEETRYYLNGIYLHAAKTGKTDVLRAVATDGHRLARMEMPLPAGGAGMPGIILPRKAVGEVRKLLDEAEGEVTFALSATKAQVQMGSIVLTTKLIDGTFPDYERVIPQNNDKVLRVNSQIFAAAVDRVATISSEKTRAVKLALGKGALRLSANSADAGGSADEELEVAYDSAPMEIGFNSKYLYEITQQIEGDAAELKLNDSASPTVVRDASDASALYVLMPMRV
jgi:DNA polymerase-3 subunit beta